MKYLDLRDIHEVSAALNFDTDDTSIIGGCDIYTIKAAGGDKKLHKNIENSLQSQHQNIVSAAARLSPEQAQEFAPDLNLARSSPFGTLSNVSNRRKFAYLVATLNATYPDYDFTNILRPDDFEKEHNHISAMRYIDQYLYNVRPNSFAGLPASPTTALGEPMWSPRMWELIDKEMGLKDCEIYRWSPSSDPFDGEDGSIWSRHFFFFSKTLKRVCYLYFRAASALSSSEPQAMSIMDRYKQSIWSESNVKAGAGKRAEYWLGHRAHRQPFDDMDDMDDMVFDHPDDPVVDAEERFTIRDRAASMDYEYTSEDDSEVEFVREREKSRVRAMSEHLAESMEV